MGRHKQTHCNKDHLLVESNLYVNNAGRRQCKFCRNKKNTQSKNKSNKKYYPSTKAKNLDRKVRVLTHYGPDGRLGCCWPDCTIEDVDMLSLDHINDDGASHRRAITRGFSHGGGGTSTYRDIEKTGYPEGFQTLCLNHQMKKQLQRYNKPTNTHPSEP